MSMKERRRLVVLEQVRNGLLTQKMASEQLGLSYRQTRRIYQKFLARGDAGLVHQLRGRPGNRRTDPAIREQAVSLYRERYSDFGCTLACEYLADHHALKVNDQTLRRWLKDAKLWRRRRKSPTRRRRRVRRERLGELVQIDGSPHDWFEGRAQPCTLMVMIDDATGVTMARFFGSETTEASMTIFKRWALTYGLPLELYPDQSSIYRVNTKQADEIESRTGKRPGTQFGRAMDELGVRLTCARSPQAKGRVERMNGTLQDRLVKAMRIKRISDMDAANAFLRKTFLPALNAKFAIEPAEPIDAHLPVIETELTAALCVREQRTVGRDHCVSWRNQVLQLKPTRGQPSLAGKRVMLRQDLTGRVTVQWRDQVVAHEPLAVRPKRKRPTVTLAERVAGHKGQAVPRNNHPWRKPRPSQPLGAGSATGSAAPRPALHQPPSAA